MPPKLFKIFQEFFSIQIHPCMGSQGGSCPEVAA